ncbi:hypothetical protein AB0O95_12750 [Rhodoglobus sp. NPDC076762]
MSAAVDLSEFETGSHRGVVSYPGMIFSVGHDPEVTDHFVRRGANYLDIGNYEYTYNAGDKGIRYRYGFVAIKLERRMPHLVLDSNKNNFLGATQLPVGYSSKQRISLEGNFDEYFTMYCPQGYQTDALYVFTPDLMALMIDEALTVDAEVVDDWLFLYHFGGFDLSDPSILTKLFRIIDTVGAKMLRRTDRYADPRTSFATPTALEARASSGFDRMATNHVAPDGARLKRGMSPPVKIAVWVVSIVLGSAVVFGVVVMVDAVLDAVTNFGTPSF